MPTPRNIMLVLSWGLALAAFLTLRERLAPVDPWSPVPKPWTIASAPGDLAVPVWPTP